MNTKAIFLVAAFGCVLMSGCAFKTASYGASIENVESIKSFGMKPVDVKKFETFSPGLQTLVCRGAGPVTVEPSYEGYIEKAFIDELRLAGVFDPNSPDKIANKINSIDFSSAMTGGKWVFAVTTSNQKGASFNTVSEYPFSSSFIGDKACQEVAQAFAPAVQKLIGDIVRNPAFRAMSK